MTQIEAGAVHKIVLACEAGMGSSALVVSQLKRQLAGLPITIEHTAVGRIPEDADLILCHRSLAQRASQVAPGKVVIPFDVFIGDPAFARVVAALKAGSTISA
jgi:mannitol-specific phosphotransferase system IIBC component